MRTENKVKNKITNKVTHLNVPHRKVKKPNAKYMVEDGIYKTKNGKYDVICSREREKLEDFGGTTPTVGFTYYGTFECYKMACYVRNAHFVAQGDITMMQLIPNNEGDDACETMIKEWQDRSIENRKLHSRAAAEAQRFVAEKLAEQLGCDLGDDFSFIIGDTFGDDDE